VGRHRHERAAKGLSGRRAPFWLTLASVALAVLANSAPTGATGATGATNVPRAAREAGDGEVDRIIVQWHATGVAANHIDSAAARAESLSNWSGVPLKPLHAIHDHLDVVRLDTPVHGEALRQTLERLRLDPTVQYVEPDAKRYILGVPPAGTPPSDPHFSAGSDANGMWTGQWYLHDPVLDTSGATPVAAVGATSAWYTASSVASTTTGVGVTVAVLDTGVDLTHPDLGLVATGGQLLPGYDFICNDTGVNCTLTDPSYTYMVANDGNGWDSDPTDPGDWISAADLAPGAFFHNKGCGQGPNLDQPVNSSWHGTRVAGILAAQTNNGIGIAGVAPDAQILPVRVIGKCSGYISDIVAGMYWAAGLTYAPLAVVPVNPYPASILNMSIGSAVPCSQTEQDAVTALANAGHLVVAAAGNDGGPVGAPANCTGVLSVAGLRHIGTKVGYSDVSSTATAITIAAPAGNCVNTLGDRPWSQPCLFSIETTSNDGAMSPGAPSYTYSLLNAGYAGNILNEGSVGTSFAAPLVSGVVALMVSANGRLTAAQIIARIQASARPFPVPAVPATGGLCHVAALTQDANGHYTDVQNTDCQCTTASCGAGMLYAPGAVSAVLAPTVSIVPSTTRASVGETVTLDGSASSSASGTVIASYLWQSDPSVDIANASSAVAKLVFPALRPVLVTLTVTDSAGRQTQASTTIYSTLISATRSGSGAVGAGALGILLAGVLGAVALRRRRVAFVAVTPASP